MRGDRPERRLASLPQQRALRLVGGDAKRRRTVRGRDRAHRLHLFGDTGRETVELDQQHRRRIARIPRAHEVLDRARDAGVHHLERGRQDPRRDRSTDRRGRGVDRIEGAEDRRHRRRIGDEAHRDPGRDAHGALGADEAAAEVVPRGIGLEAAERRGLAVGQHHVDRQHVRARDPGGQAVRTAGVGRDVAADRAGLL